MEPLTLRPQYVGSPLDFSLSAFLLDREASRCTSKTLQHYQYTCGSFVEWLQVRNVSHVGEITPHHIRAYLVSLQRRGLEESPMRNVAMPRLEKRVPAPFSREDIHKLLARCDRQTHIGARNYAIVLTLLDTGLRAAEFCSLNIGDIDMRSGLTTILGKGRKMREI